MSSTAGAVNYGAGSATSISDAQGKALATGQGSSAISGVDATALSGAFNGSTNTAVALSQSLAQALGVNAHSLSDSSALARDFAYAVGLPVPASPSSPCSGSSPCPPSSPAPQVAGVSADQPLPMSYLYLIRMLSQVKGSYAQPGQTAAPAGYTLSNVDGTPVVLGAEADQPTCVSQCTDFCTALLQEIQATPSSVTFQ